jgi:glycosyltransferase involved in cell wall biosynthesis
MLAAHRTLGTWREKITAYIALSQFARQKFIEGGLPAERIAVKPNFVHPDPGRKRGPGEYALFVGRLSEEKGLRVLLKAWEHLHTDIPLHIAGDGPLKNELQGAISGNKIRGCTALGPLSGADVLRAMQSARVLIVPSVWFEGFPVTIAESFACGLPVIASRLGSLHEIVDDGCTGMHFSAGNPEELAANVEWAWSHPSEIAAMGRNARAEYEAKYTAEINYEFLVGLWNQLGIGSGRKEES